MKFNGRFEGEQDLYPLQICFVDKVDGKILEAAMKFDLPILESDSNNNDMAEPLTRTIYVFNDFEDHKMFPIIEKTPITWILGPTALEEISRNPDLELRSKPTFCTFLYGLVFYINCPENVSLMRRLVRLIKWMGGRFSNRPSRRTTHMISTRAIAEGYTYCITFDVPILTPDWVEYCWLHRGLPNFDITKDMNTFRLKMCAGLYIAFKGPSTEELKELESAATTNGAVIVQLDDLRCTHLVVSHDVEIHLNLSDIPTHINFVVQEEWFMATIRRQHRVSEDQYLCFPTREIKKKLWQKMGADKKSIDSKERPTFDQSLHDDKNRKKEIQDVKRKYAFEDLYFKEKNYVCCLKHLCKMQDLATNRLHHDGAILNEPEAKAIFGNIADLVKVHQEYLDYLEKTLKNWENDAITVHQLVISKDELLKQYIIYTANYKESVRLLEESERTNKRFRQLLENFKLGNKEHPKYIFIRPIQRLCSIVLQIQEIRKYTRENNPDMEFLDTAIETVKDILQKINKTQELAEQIQDTHENQNYMEYLQVTPYHGELIVQFSAVEPSLTGTLSNVQVMFFLFSNILEVAKIKTKYFQFQKRYVHVATIPLSMIMNVIEFEGEEDDNQNLFGLTVKTRKKEGTCIYCFKYSSKDGLQLKDILQLIAKRLVTKGSSQSSGNLIQSLPISGTSICQLTKCKEKTFNINPARDLLSVPFGDTKQNLRKSRSCGDLVDLSNVL
ncbi:protein ECT2-like isoform X2 [Macrosteles quadrilineatus]|uniref:protein ECT2-like isoform X2 n=1 Tax=Macrosteles quadrilineatus TaxID=74068 RepID=UPI0023E183EC|nr:protein ECT2-like isoform X2 [Macrosteles quadrilineatus]